MSGIVQLKKVVAVPPGSNTTTHGHDVVALADGASVCGGRALVAAGGRNCNIASDEIAVVAVADYGEAHVGAGSLCVAGNFAKIYAGERCRILAGIGCVIECSHYCHVVAGIGSMVLPGGCTTLSLEHEPSDGSLIKFKTRTVATIVTRKKDLAEGRWWGLDTDGNFIEIPGEHDPASDAMIVAEWMARHRPDVVSNIVNAESESNDAPQQAKNAA